MIITENKVLHHYYERLSSFLHVFEVIYSVAEVYYSDKICNSSGTGCYSH